MKNQIVLNDVVHEFVQDKPRVDNCYKCSLRKICDEKFDKFICSMFFDDKIENGYFEVK